MASSQTIHENNNELHAPPPSPTPQQTATALIGNKPILFKIHQTPVRAKALGFQQKFGSFLEPALIIGLEFPGMGNVGQQVNNYICNLQLIDSVTRKDLSIIDYSGSHRHQVRNDDDDDEEEEEDEEGEGEYMPRIAPVFFAGDDGNGGPKYSPFYDNLKGVKLSSGVVLRDPEDLKEKLFFVFGEISVRTTGVYRLIVRISEMRYNLSENRMPWSTLYITTTEEFIVHGPRSFPKKLLPDLPLTISFKDQGIHFLNRRRNSVTERIAESSSKPMGGKRNKRPASSMQQ